LYHKIRISFGVIQDMLIPFDNLLEQLRIHQLVNFSQRVEWDIYLMTTNEFKDEILHGELPLEPDARHQILLQPMPRFMWRAMCLDNDSPILDLLFDATDIEQGSYVVRANEYDVTLSAVLRGLAQDSDFQQQFRDRSSWQIFEWLLTDQAG